ncbi:MAG: hypothetical protein J6P19_01815 [Acetobacter sp.]|nr:hypothetical protein [Acetobacter sp.]
MKKATLSALLFLAACQAPQYGILMKPPPSRQAQIIIADDTFEELETLYPPGPTKIAFRQNTPDIMGQLLVSKLRHAGYAVAEFDNTTAAPSGFIPLHYVLDSTSLYHWRIKLTLGNTTLNRAYQEVQTLSGSLSCVPTGTWTAEHRTANHE